MSPPHDERDRITAAMTRILSGRPERSNGALTIVAQAQEAGVPRNALTQRHLDLKNQFYEHVKQRGAIPDVEVRLRATFMRLKKTIAGTNEELAQLRADIPALVRVINQLAAENLELRTQLQMPAAKVVPIRPGNGQPIPPPSPLYVPGCNVAACSPAAAQDYHLGVTCVVGDQCPHPRGHRAPVSADVPQELPGDPVIYAEVPVLAAAVPEATPKDPPQAGPAGQIHEDHRVCRLEPDRQARGVVPVDNPPGCRDQFALQICELVLV